jgi:anti-sigma regulatory factor (Ser/Thr protein kinase)
MPQQPQARHDRGHRWEDKPAPQPPRRDAPASYTNRPTHRARRPCPSAPAAPPALPHQPPHASLSRLPASAGPPAATPANPAATPAPNLPPQPAAPGRARRLTRDWLNRWDMAALTDAAVAIASELTANAVAAVPPGTTGLSVIIAIHATPSGLRISAWDIGPGHPQPAHAGPDAETGRGLTLIHALTEGNWGWWPTPASGGKVTWATLTAPEPPAGYIP